MSIVYLQAQGTFSKVTGFLNAGFQTNWADLQNVKAQLERNNNVSIELDRKEDKVSITCLSMEDFQTAVDYLKRTLHVSTAGVPEQGDSATHGHQRGMVQRQKSYNPDDYANTKEDYDNIQMVKILLSQVEYEAFLFFYEHEPWLKDFAMEFKGDCLLVPVESARFKNVEIMIESKLRKVREMNKQEMLIPADKKVDTQVIDKIKTDVSEIEDGKVFCHFEGGSRILHFFCPTYEIFCKAKHKAEICLGMQKVSAGRRHRRFAAGPADDLSKSVVKRGDSFDMNIDAASPPQSPQATETVDFNKSLSGPVKSEFKTTEGLKVKVYTGSILKLNVDCIVNAANGSLAHGGGVAYVISRAAGYEFDRESRDYIQKNGTIKVGDCCITSAGDLPYKNVIHTVGPRWSDHGKDQCLALLRKSVAACFYMADQHDLRTIALPSISAGEIFVDILFRQTNWNFR